jgi:hypothetical protein
MSHFYTLFYLLKISNRRYIHFYFNDRFGLERLAPEITVLSTLVSPSFSQCVSLGCLQARQILSGRVTFSPWGKGGDLPLSENLTLSGLHVPTRCPMSSL